MKNRGKKSRNLGIVERTTHWIGSPASVIFHTVFFVGIFGLVWLNFTVGQILLILTTAVSLEAIYLAIFIQMTVNRHAESLSEVEEDIEELGEEFDDISEDIEEDEKLDQETRSSLGQIQHTLQEVLKELNTIKKDKK